MKKMGKYLIRNNIFARIQILAQPIISFFSFRFIKIYWLFSNITLLCMLSFRPFPSYILYYVPFQSSPRLPILFYSSFISPFGTPLSSLQIIFVLQINMILNNLRLSTGLSKIFALARTFTSKKELNFLSNDDYLLPRHIGPSEDQTKQMLKVLKASSVDQLIKQAIPENIIDPQSLEDNSIGQPIPQSLFIQRVKQQFSKNQIYKCYIGGGFHPNILPAVIQRNLLQNPGWYTAYTPYQAEISQGRLQSLINYQTVVQQLTGLDFSNASLLDEASAGGEAFYMAYNVHNGEKKKFFIDENVFQTTIAVIKTRATYINVEVVIGSYKQFLQSKYKQEQYCGLLVQNPDRFGSLIDFTDFFKNLDNLNHNTVKIVASDLLALTISKSPKDMGADISFGSSQRLGVPMGFGGPYSGFFASKKNYVRKMPGRIIGISKDAQGNLGYRMALQTRQQHIRRQKATSNICTAQALLANISAMYAIYHGPKGLRKISHRINNIAQIAERIFISHGFETLSQNSKDCSFFDTITIINCDAKNLEKSFLEERVNIRVTGTNIVSLSFNETNNYEDLEEIDRILKKHKGQKTSNSSIHSYDLTRKQFSSSLIRDENFMKQKIFNQIHSEHQMLRYLRFLQQKDISLDRSMIPLGSCTMKLNASSQMVPLTWPELNIHPYVHKDQAKGYRSIINSLKQWLKSVTKFDEICFQPNSGATGQYAGLITINRYLKSIGQEHRKICLIPKSAHGTNPASAILAGMKVIPVQVHDGKIDLQDFKEKAQKYKNQLGALMVTFPSTAGRYQSTIQQINQITHQYGGQVYMDGANMNAQVGYTSPGFLGADVCHLNLHKTFSIPHGGGGPGMGPIGVKKHLIPFLPSHPYSQDYSDNSSGTIAASQFGSASILSISYAYIAMLGKEGVRKSTAFAILNANYLMTRLRSYYDIMYIEEGDRCSHQFIIDLTNLKKKTGISQQDIAKRLMDFGFHAPTMSFPVAGSLMVQPTQSQDKGQLDRFADALIKIHEEIHSKPELVKNAPYTADSLLRSEWNYNFTRQQAAYPLPWVLKRGKYWPTVRRISNPYGDKNLVCACPDISAYLQK